MKRIRNLFKKDRYGVLRGGLGMGLLIALSAMLTTYGIVLYDAAFEEERASDAARRVAAQFEHLVDDAFERMNATADLLDAATVEEGALLENLTQYGPFTEAGVVREGALRGADGSVSPVQEGTSYVHYTSTNRSEKIIAQTDSVIQLRVSLGEAGELAAWVDPSCMDEAMQCAFFASYNYAVYNSTTGAFLLNCTPFAHESYYDTLLELNEDGKAEALLSKGSAQTRIRDREGGAYYIAQRQTGVLPWSIALMLPESLVGSHSTIVQTIPVAMVVIAVFLILVLTLQTAFALYRIRQTNRRTERALEVGERALNTAAAEARATLLVYQRGSDSKMPCYDGLGLIGGASGGARRATFKEIEAACRLSEEDMEQLRERMRELAVGATAELTLRSLAKEREEHLLRFVLSAPRDDGNTIIISVRDCTFQVLSQNQEEEERNYRRAVESRTESIWQINISRDRWRLVHARQQKVVRALDIVQGAWREYSADLNGAMRNYVMPDDYDDYADSLSIAGISAMYRSGKFQHTSDYRVRIGEDYVWHRMTLRISINPETGDILANIYVFNVDAEKNAELERGERKRILHQTLTALGSLYYGLYYVDLEKDLCYAAKAHGGELVTKLCTPYKVTFDAYIDTVVHPDDRERLRNMLSAYTLHRSMTEGSHYQRCEYRRRTDDGYRRAEVIVQPARFENGIVREVVLALNNIEDREKAD